MGGLFFRVSALCSKLLPNSCIYLQRRRDFSFCSIALRFPPLPGAAVAMRQAVLNMRTTPSVCMDFGWGDGFPLHAFVAADLAAGKALILCLKILRQRPHLSRRGSMRAGAVRLYTTIKIIYNQLLAINCTASAYMRIRATSGSVASTSR